METRWGENNDACWRAASRANDHFPGRAPGPRRHQPSLKDKVQLFLSASRFREARARALALPASSMSQTSLGSLSRPCAGREWVREKAFMDSTRSFLQSSATSDSCVNVKKQRGRMPPAAKGLSPFGKGENNDACWRAGSHFVVPVGLSPGRQRHLPAFSKDKVQLFLEAHPDSARPGRGLWRCRLRACPRRAWGLCQGLAPVANGFEEGVHGFDEELFAVVGDKRQLRKR